MRLSFREVAPAAEPWVGALGQIPIIKQAIETAWVFAVVEAAHLLSLAVIGGAVLALNLRLLGLALPGEPAADVERRTRPWLHAGVIGALVTGVAMGVMNAAVLYPSVAFFVKMVALVGAVLFSYAVVREVARNSDGPSRTAVLLAAAALAVWVFAVIVFATTPGVNPGLVLVVAAGVALLGAAARRHRPLLIGGLGVIMTLGWIVSNVVLSPETNFEASSAATTFFVVAAALFALAVGALEIRSEKPDGGISAKLAAFASTLAWVTVAAAGRWIGFS